MARSITVSSSEASRQAAEHQPTRSTTPAGCLLLFLAVGTGTEIKHFPSGFDIIALDVQELQTIHSRHEEVGRD